MGRFVQRVPSYVGARSALQAEEEFGRLTLSIAMKIADFLKSEPAVEELLANVGNLQREAMAKSANSLRQALRPSLKVGELGRKRSYFGGTPSRIVTTISGL